MFLVWLGRPVWLPDGESTAWDKLDVSSWTLGVVESTALGFLYLTAWEPGQPAPPPYVRYVDSQYWSYGFRGLGGVSFGNKFRYQDFFYPCSLQCLQL